MKTKQRLIGIVLLLVAYNSYSQTITINIISPTPNQVIIDSNLNITVQVSSTPYEIATVIATFPGRQLPLTFDAVTGYFKGKLSLTGLPVNSPIVMQVLATDDFNNQNTASVSFISNYDPPPILVVDSLLNGSNANPLIHIRAATIDNGNCTLNIKMFDPTSGLFGTPFYDVDFRNSVDSIFDLSIRAGKYLYILFSATDSRGQTAKPDTAKVSVESSPYLKKIFTADNAIFDFNFNKVLTHDGYGAEKITDIFTGLKKNVPIPIPMGKIDANQGQSLLTPTGAIFAAGDNQKKLFELYKDSVYVLDDMLNKFGWNLKVSGNFAGFSSRFGPIFTRNFDNSDKNPVPDSAGGYFDIKDNGLITCSTEFGHIIKILDGAPVLITPTNKDTASINPLTDGKNFVYVRTPDRNLIAFLYLYDGQFETELSNFDSNQTVSSSGTVFTYPLPLTGYQVNNGRVVYVKKGPTGFRQIWLRDSTGNSVQKTFFSKNSSLDFLDPKGNLTIIVDELERYYIKAGSSQLIPIGTTLGNTYYRDSTLYLGLGTGLYKIDLNIAPNSLANSTILFRKDSIYKFTTADFSRNFKGPGNLMLVRLASLPVNGILKLNNVPVTVDTEIARADLAKLTYTPNAGSTLTDSISWNGSNGLNYTSNNATMKISIRTPYYTNADGNWDNPATWLNNVIPPFGADVIIRNIVTDDVNVTCNSVQIVPPGNLIVKTGVTLTVP